MRRLSPIALALMLWGPGCGAPSSATVTAANPITNGKLDGGAHPYVGTIALLEADGSWSNRCSGSLISSTVFLTAGHCVVNRLLGRAHGTYGVSFDADFYGPTRTIITGTYFLHPQWAQGPSSGSIPNDIGVILLDAAVSDRGLATLPGADLLTQLAEQGGLRSQKFTLVGYGATDASRGGGFRVGVDGVRRTGTSLFQALPPAGDLIYLQGNKALGLNDVCYQDSGGPDLFEGTNLIAGVNSLIDPNCTAVARSQRIDTDNIRAFLAQFVTLP